jgi:hypothetical protein
LKVRNSRRGGADSKFEFTSELVYAFFWLEDNSVVLDTRKLRERVDGMVSGAREVGVDLGDPETVWIAKFSSVVSKVILHKVLMEGEGVEVASGFGKLYLPAFMEKIPLNSIHVELWSDAFETNPVGDTWFS